MIDVKDKLIEVLTEAGYVEGKTIFLHNSMPADMPYPDTFITFKNEDTFGDDYYDNEPYKIVWNFYINVYSNDPIIVNTELLRLKPMFKRAGFIPIGSGYDIKSDENSHTGRGYDLKYIELNKEEFYNETI